MNIIDNEQSVLLYMQIKSSKYCGSLSDVPQILTFDTEVLTLTFVSDYSVTKAGFKIMYKILTRKGLLFDSIVIHYRYHSSI